MADRVPPDSSDLGRLRRLEALDELVPMLIGVLDVRDVFVRISTVAQGVLPHDLVGLPLMAEDGVHVIVQAIAGRVKPDVPTASCCRQRNWRRHPGITSSSATPCSIQTSADCRRPRPVAAPSYDCRCDSEGRFLGALDFYSLTPDFYQTTDVLIGRRIADLVLLALSHQRLAEEQSRNEILRSRDASLALLDEVVAAMTESGQLPQVWDRISNATQKVLAHDALLLSALLPDGVRGRVYASRAPGTAAFAEYVSVPPAVISNPAWEYDLVQDLQAQPDQKNLESTKLGYRAALRIPLRLDGEFVAALSFLSFTPSAYSVADVAIARRVGDRLLRNFARERRIALMKRANEASERASRLEARVHELTEELDSRTGYRRVIGQSRAWKNVLTQATQVAATDTTALLLGESGTGKEVIARFVHRASPRKGGPFVALNCAALPEQLLEAELFGYERGAFTGAVNSKPASSNRRRAARCSWMKSAR
jgi:GAF domain-containing protein